MIDFTENIDSLEKMVWNFILNPSNEDNELRPSSHDSLRREELIIMVKPAYFNDEIRQESYKAALKFFKEYEKVPNRRELSSYLEVLNFNTEDINFDDLYEFNLREYNYEYLYKYVKSFILLRNLNLTVVDILTYLKTSSVDPENIDKISEKVRNDISTKLALNFSSGDTGLNFKEVASHMQISKEGSPTGFQFFDKTQGGGWNKKSLVVAIGRPKVGKSLFLGNVAARAFLAGCVTGIFTVELSDRKYMKRVGANILNIPSKDYDKAVTDSELANIASKLNTFCEDNPNVGELYIKEYPTGSATAIDLENYFLRLENKLNKKFSVIVVDYLNLMRPLKDQSGLYEKIKCISEELRGVAMRNDWCIISATQVRREDVDNYDLSMDSVSESFGLVHTVDALYGLMRQPLESRMKIKVIANRDNGYEESYKFYGMQKDYMRLVEETGPTSEYYSDDDEANAMVDQIREEYTQFSEEVTQSIQEDDYDALFNSI